MDPEPYKPSAALSDEKGARPFHGNSKSIRTEGMGQPRSVGSHKPIAGRGTNAMRADTLSPKDIFGRDIRFLIPMFQRPYVWKEAEHWGPLWEDVAAVADHLLDRMLELGPDKTAQAQQDTPPHFLGAIVIDQQFVAVANFDTRHVIDGQQRLTTLQLLLDAAQEVVEEFGNPIDAKLLERLTLNEAALAQHPDDVFKVWPTNTDRSAFRAAMTNGTKVPDSLKSRPIVAAHRFFKQSVEEWAAADPGVDEASIAERLAALTTVLRGLLRLVVIDLEPHDNAQVIFETLNARGTPLLASDLVKNVLLQSISETQADVEVAYENHWRQFDTEPWRREVRQGRLKRPRIDLFLDYWLKLRLTRDFPAHQLYPEFRAYLKERSDSLDVLKDLHSMSEVFDRLDTFAWDSPEGTFMYRYRVMEQAVFTPFLLMLFSHDSDALPVVQRQNALSAFESWLVRRMIVRGTAKDYNRLQIDLLEWLADRDPATAGDDVRAFLLRQTADSREWPSDEQVQVALREEEIYRRMKRARLRMILEALEDQLRSPKSEQEFAPRGRLTIEHVMPQTWEINWTLPEGDEAETQLAAARRKHLVHTIGNLTLVNEKLNPALSNLPWERKRAELQKHSVLKLNAAMLHRSPHIWDETTILTRSEWIAHEVIRIWPRG